MKTIRWKKLLPEYTFGELLIVNIKSGFFILVLPGQLISEGIKPLLLKRNSASTQHVIMSVLVDKILGIIAVFISGLFGFMLSEIKIGYGPKISLIIAILLILGMLFLIRIPSVYNLILKSLGISNLDTNSMNGIKKKVYNILSIWKNYVKDRKHSNMGAYTLTLSFNPHASIQPK